MYILTRTKTKTITIFHCKFIEFVSKRCVGQEYEQIYLI